MLRGTDTSAPTSKSNARTYLPLVIGNYTQMHLCSQKSLITEVAAQVQRDLDCIKFLFLTLAPLVYTFDHLLQDVFCHGKFVKWKQYATSERCIGDAYAHMVSLNYLRSFFSKYPRAGKFAFSLIYEVLLFKTYHGSI